MTEPGTPEFYAPREPEPLGDPTTDPPMTVRVHPDDDPYSPTARRVIRTDARQWVLVTGPGVGRHDGVATWPVQHPLVWATAYRHAEAAKVRRLSPAAELAGDDITGAGDNLFR
jgi:hypothetical protein